MIWVLSEITLPLVLAFLFGLSAGWLFWRWRRRSISQTEWNNHGKMSATDALKFSSLQEEVGVYQRRAEQLDVTSQQHHAELSDAQKRAEALTTELQTANQKIAALDAKASSDKNNTDNSVINFEMDQSTDLLQESAENEEKLQQAMVREKQQGTKITELEFRSTNLQNRVDEQEKLLQQANRDIKKLHGDLKSANEELKSKVLLLSDDKSAENIAEIESKISKLETEKADLETELKKLASEKTEVEQKLRQESSDLLSQKTIVDELKARTVVLESTIEKHADELLHEKKVTNQATHDLENLRTQLSQQVDSSDKNLRTLKSDLDLETKEKNNALQKLKEAATDNQNKQATTIELQRTIENLEITVEKQSSELKDADSKLAIVSDDLKAALEQLEKQNRNNSDKLGEQQLTLNTTISEKAQLTQKLQETISHSNSQTALTNELQQKLKQSETVTTERDDAIAKLKQLETELDNANQQNDELQHTKGQLQTVTQRFRNFQASAVANRQSREERVEKLKARVQQLSESLEKQRKNSSGPAPSPAPSPASGPATDNQNVLQLQAQIAQAKKETAEVTAQLNKARVRNNQLAASVPTVKPPAPVTPISIAQINKLKKTVQEKEEQIKALEKKLEQQAAKSKAAKRKSPVKKNPAKKNQVKKNQAKKDKLSWQQGETRIGTPGSNHKDDLTAINGIGPKIEKALTRLGIKSWEQLATLKVADIKRVDEKLTDFSGRITRDEWVPQAKAIIRNGHQPVAKPSKKANKKPKKQKTAKAAWQQGETRFGTPGSIHKDDLQVINGIGPVIEKALNRRGVKSWEQLASLKAKDIKTIDEALDFPGRIKRENWVAQAKALMKQFPNHKDRPTRRTFLNQVAVAR